LPPFTPEQLEQMWEYAPPCGTAQTLSTKPEVMQLRDNQAKLTELDSSDLTHFTPLDIVQSESDARSSVLSTAVDTPVAEKETGAGTRRLVVGRVVHACDPWDACGVLFVVLGC